MRLANPHLAQLMPGILPDLIDSPSMTRACRPSTPRQRQRDTSTRTHETNAQPSGGELKDLLRARWISHLRGNGEPSFNVLNERISKGDMRQSDERQIDADVYRSRVPGVNRIPTLILMRTPNP